MRLSTSGVPGSANETSLAGKPAWRGDRGDRAAPRHPPASPSDKAMRRARSRAPGTESMAMGAPSTALRMTFASTLSTWEERLLPLAISICREMPRRPARAQCGRTSVDSYGLCPMNSALRRSRSAHPISRRWARPYVGRISRTGAANRGRHRKSAARCWTAGSKRPAFWLCLSALIRTRPSREAANAHASDEAVVRRIADVVVEHQPVVEQRAERMAANLHRDRVGWRRRAHDLVERPCPSA